jgi:hypothetical protein
MDCENVIRHIQHSLKAYQSPVDQLMLRLASKSLFDFRSDEIRRKDRLEWMYREMKCNFIHIYVTKDLIIRITSSNVTIIRKKEVIHTCIDTAINMIIEMVNPQKICY